MPSTNSQQTSKRSIFIKGARTHNLKNINLEIPHDALIVITGLSGSGKSSLAFDTLYAEGQRRYVESLSTYARQFLAVMERPDCDEITGLSPAIAIAQKAPSRNPRSTVGTITEIYDHLRLLFARIGIPHCPEHKIPLTGQPIDKMVQDVLSKHNDQRMMLLAPIVKSRKGEHTEVINRLISQGFIRARIDGTITDLDQEEIKLAKTRKHSIDVVIDRFRVQDDINLRLTESFETALELGEGIAFLSSMDAPEPDKDTIYSSNLACPHCHIGFDELSPQLFSFNSPKGACPTCEGLGIQLFFDPQLIVADPQLSLTEGAIHTWDKGNAYAQSLVTTLSHHYNFLPVTPFCELPQTIQDIVLYGSKSEKIKFSYTTTTGKTLKKNQPFEGVIPNIERRYKSTTSSLSREYLSKFLNEKTCQDCDGSRLNNMIRHVFIDEYNIADYCSMHVAKLLEHLGQLTLPKQQSTIAEKIVQGIDYRLSFLKEVGLNYLSLNRRADTLSGGESQRIRLASQIGSGLVGVMYILDEPSIGLHQRDNDRLIKTLNKLKNIGNTVIVVEHDEEIMHQADLIVDIGPAAGIHGGNVVAMGTAKELAQNTASITGQFLSGKQSIIAPEQRTCVDPKKMITLEGAHANNLKSVNVAFPVGLFVCVTGVSGSGKSSLIQHTLLPAALEKKRNKKASYPFVKNIKGLDLIDKIININQTPIGRTPRSNPATYTNLFTPIREIFAATVEARSRGYKPGRFSFNTKGGRCEACQGDGILKVSMHFLPDVYVTCDTCQGKRYNPPTLDIKYKGKSIIDVLNMTIDEAHVFFQPIPTLARRLKTLQKVGLGYITLGQSATTLSGGEAQRIKLSKELAKRNTGNTLYIMDEPTTGLHFADIKKLLEVVHTLRDNGNTIIMIEHNLDVIKSCDWIIDVGPEGGIEGGEIIAEGTPESICEHPTSFTGKYLKLHVNH